MERTSVDRRADGLAGVEFLMPDRGQGIARGRERDFIEDANFEVVGGGHSSWAESVPPLMPEAPDPNRHLRGRAIPPAGERLDFFGKAAAYRGGTTAGPTLPVFAVFLFLAAGTVFWMSGGHALFVPRANLVEPVEAGVATHEPILSPVAGSAASIPPAAISEPARQQAEPVRRPPRIERAGSILMIRSGG